MTQNYQTLAIFCSEIIQKNTSMSISNLRTQANRQNALQSIGPLIAAGKTDLDGKAYRPQRIRAMSQAKTSFLRNEANQTGFPV